MCYYLTLIPVWTRGSSLSMYTRGSLTDLAHCKHGCYHGWVRLSYFSHNHSQCSYSGISVGIDQRSSAETCLKIVNHCSADILVVDKPYQLDKILKVYHNYKFPLFLS